jgi:hypothetical protein
VLVVRRVDAFSSFSSTLLASGKATLVSPLFVSGKFASARVIVCEKENIDEKLKDSDEQDFQHEVLL